MRCGRGVLTQFCCNTVRNDNNIYSQSGFGSQEFGLDTTLRETQINVIPVSVTTVLLLQRLAFLLLVFEELKVSALLGVPAPRRYEVWFALQDS